MIISVSEHMTDYMYWIYVLTICIGTYVFDTSKLSSFYLQLLVNIFYKLISFS